jgi:hypothetical protein
MARLFIDGFESGGLDLWDSLTGSVIVDAAPDGMSGSYAMKIPNATLQYADKMLPLAMSEIYLKFRFRWGNPVAADVLRSIIGFRSGTTLLADYRMGGASGPTAAYAGSTLIGSGLNLTVATTYLIEIYFKLADSGGRFVVKVNGVTEIDFTGDTKPGADTTFDRVQFGPSASTYVVNQWFDDVVFDDAAWPGNTKIAAIRPSGAGNSAQWTPSAGANWECVDEVPASDTDYVETNVVDKVDLYDAGSLPAAADAIVCVQVQARVLKEGAATPQNLALGLRTVGTDYFSPDKVAPTAYKSLSHLWENNPNTSVPFTVSEVNALEIGMKSKT